ncbi:MAG: zinc ribbon domain-containing protein [Candidatus Lokiarchaeota archaeon]|nr:zinc ribbon domain-containing protein [Candidatus Lokiarchaeota archaeon]
MDSLVLESYQIIWQKIKTKLLIKASRNLKWGSCGFTDPDVTLELQFSGSGTLDNPYLITTRKFWLNDLFQLDLFNSTSYLLVKGIALNALYLTNCKNITLKDVNLKYLGLENCSIISIENVNILKHLKLSKVSQIKIIECNIGKLFAYSGDHISILYSEIKKISRKSKARIYIQSKYENPLSNVKSETKKTKLNLEFWLCPQCGTEVDMFSRFCHNCGFRFNK